MPWLHGYRAVVRLLAFVKMRTFSISGEELWRDEWSNPLREDITISDPQSFLQIFEQSLDSDSIKQQVDARFAAKSANDDLGSFTSINCGQASLRGLQLLKVIDLLAIPLLSHGNPALRAR